MLFGLPPIHADIVDYTARAAIVEGYNSNVYQDVDPNNVQYARRHPSLFTGIDGTVQMRVTGKTDTVHDFRLGARVQHYELSSPNPIDDDGSVFASISSKSPISKRWRVYGMSIGTITSANSSHISDGTLLLDPTTSRRTYYLLLSDVGFYYDISPTTRWLQRAGLSMTGTFSAAPIDASAAAAQLAAPHAFDAVTPEVEAYIFKDHSDRLMSEFRARVKDTYTPQIIDLRTLQPISGASYLWGVTGSYGLQYKITPDLMNRTIVGASLSAAPPIPGQPTTPILSPLLQDQLYYTTEFYYLAATAGYDYGSVNPRFGFGPTFTVGLNSYGQPYRIGKWRNFAVMANAALARSSVTTTGNNAQHIDFYDVGIQFRYGVNKWLGLTWGYDFRDAFIQGPGSVPVLRHVAFFGLSGYWSTDPEAPPLTAFRPPIVPPS